MTLPLSQFIDRGRGVLSSRSFDRKKRMPDASPISSARRDESAGMEFLGRNRNVVSTTGENKKREQDAVVCCEVRRV